MAEKFIVTAAVSTNATLEATNSAHASRVGCRYLRHVRLEDLECCSEYEQQPNEEYVLIIEDNQIRRKCHYYL